MDGKRSRRSLMTASELQPFMNDTQTQEVFVDAELLKIALEGLNDDLKSGDGQQQEENLQRRAKRQTPASATLVNGRKQKTPKTDSDTKTHLSSGSKMNSLELQQQEEEEDSEDDVPLLANRRSSVAVVPSPIHTAQQQQQQEQQQPQQIPQEEQLPGAPVDVDAEPERGFISPVGAAAVFITPSAATQAPPAHAPPSSAALPPTVAQQVPGSVPQGSMQKPSPPAVELARAILGDLYAAEEGVAAAQPSLGVGRPEYDPNLVIPDR